MVPAELFSGPGANSFFSVVSSALKIIVTGERRVHPSPPPLKYATASLHIPRR